MASEAQAFAQQFLTFRLGEETFGVDVLQVREILDLIPVTRVPQMPDYMLGVINLRGSVVPVVDLRCKFGLPPVAATRESCIVVLEVELAGERSVIGALTDAVSEVLDLTEADIEPPPRLGTRLKAEFIRGMGQKDGRFQIILDIDRIFSCDELAPLHDV